MLCIECNRQIRSVIRVEMTFLELCGGASAGDRNIIDIKRCGAGIADLDVTLYYGSRIDGFQANRSRTDDANLRLRLDRMNCKEEEREKEDRQT